MPKQLKTTEEIFQTACRLFEDGELAPAELYIRDVLDRDPKHAGAFNLLGRVCLALGMSEKAIEAFERALNYGPDFQGARKNLETAKQHSSRNKRSHPGYLLSKAWGFGFWSDVSQTLGALLLAEMTGRIPVIHWGNNSLFHYRHDRDGFRLYFDPVSDVTIDDLSPDNVGSIFPAKWTLETLRTEDNAKWEGDGSRLGGIFYLNRPEDLVVVDFYPSVLDLLPWLTETHPMHGKSVDEVFRYLTGKYLTPRDNIMDDVRSFYETHLAHASTVAVHLRGSDKRQETIKLDDINKQILEKAAHESDDSKIFLLTDDTRCLSFAYERFGERIIHTDSLRTELDIGLHLRLYPSIDRLRLGTDVMKDVYIALECEKFFGNGKSSVSAMIAVMKQWPSNSCHLLEKSGLYERNRSLYSMPALIPQELSKE